MSGTVVLMLLFSGLGFLPSCSPRFYVLVPVSKTWTDAQNYCRSNYSDLAAAETNQDLAELNRLIGSEANVWIGLRADTEAWRWSLEKQDYYGVGEDGFRMWFPGEPSFGSSQYKACVVILGTGKWSDVVCSSRNTFICQSSGTQNSSSFILVNQALTWVEAQSYCRLHYADLASVRNQAENDQMSAILRSSYTWIGLYRDSWQWPDGSLPSVSWNPTAVTTDTCVASLFGRWTNLDCSTKHYFACCAVPVRRLLVQVELKNLDSSVDVEELNESLLQKLNVRMKNQILNGAVTVGWVQLHEGKVFIKKDTGTKEAGKCPFTQ